MNEKKEYGWKLQEIILVAMLCIVFGVVYLAGVYLALGWYPPLQERFEAIRPKGLRAAAKLFVFLLCVLGLYAALIWLFQLESVVRETAEATPLLLLALLGTGCVTFLLTDVLLRRFAVLWRRKLRGRWMRG